MPGQGADASRQAEGVNAENCSIEGDEARVSAGRARSVNVYGLNYSSLGMAQNYASGYGYGAWTFGTPVLPMLPLLPNTANGRGLLSLPLASLGLQGGGILKKSRGHARRHASGRFNGGARGGKNLTKAALDADLDEWRLKGNRFAEQSLDAELDDYWSKKRTLDSNEEAGS